MSYRSYSRVTNFRGRRSGGSDVEGLRWSTETVMRHYGSVSDDVTPTAISCSRFPDTDREGGLIVKHVDFSIEQNTTYHKTNQYDIVSAEDVVHQLVVRRGKPFSIDVLFNRHFNQKIDDLKLVFMTGDSPLESKGTHANLVVSDKDEEGKWGAKIVKNIKETLTVSIATPPTCFVGKWRFKVDVIRKGESDVEIFRYNHREPIYVIFNPWCKGDQTYFPDKTESGPDELLLTEYVMNESGRLYTGSSKHITSRPWNFGQFDGDVLNCAMLLVDSVSPTARGDPVKVVRKLTSLVNSLDNDGVVSGNWSGDYSGGTSPTTWTGSVAILEEYYKTQRPVQFGQCWVFSGVLTTVLRSLGIPARSITNFASAHDTDGSITIDIHFSENGDVMEDMNKDTIWNFHVWNEAYMSRPDLPKGYGGWQVCDATPQEQSDGVFCCGPVSVRAIKNGEVQQPHDAGFVFAEVNADKVFWNVRPDGHTQRTNILKRSIGKCISTKKPGSRLGNTDSDREDVTKNYKYEEGSTEERAAVLRANQAGSTRSDIYGNPESHDVNFELVEYENIDYGKPFKVHLKIQNTRDLTRTVAGKLSVSSVFYTGVHANLIKSEQFSIVLGGNEEQEIKLPVSYAEYGDKLVQHCMLKHSVLCRVDETKQVHADQDDFRLSKPHLTIKIPNDVKVKQKFSTGISFTNPLPTTLTNCKLVIEGSGVQKTISLRQPNVAARASFVASFDMTPSKSGDRNLILNFTSNELEGITGVCSFHVTK